MNSTSSSYLADIRSIFGDGSISNLSDGELLDRFVSRRDELAEPAFTLLVKRHGPMVLRVCRGILADPNDADDAFQATFMVLARKAGMIRNRDSVASFLHGVCLRAARDLHSASVRRKSREGVAFARFSFPEDRIEIVDAVNEAVDRLPKRYRDPIVLCELEGLTCDEAAQRLRCPVGTVKSRLSRGRDRLRAHWNRRGLTSGLVFGSPAVVPADLADSTARFVMPFAEGTTSAALAERLIQAMAAGKLKVAATSLLAAAITFVAGENWVLTSPSAASPTVEIAAASSQKNGLIIAAGAQDDDEDGLPGELTGPSRNEIEDLIRKIGRAEATPELVDQITSYFRPRATQKSRYWNELLRRVADASFVGRMDALARELTGKKADTRNLISRALGDHAGRQDDLHRVEMRDYLSRLAEPAKTLRGRVLDEDSKPIQRALISTSGAIARSDAEGDFTLLFHRPHLPFSTIYVEAKGYGLSEVNFLAHEIDENRHVYRISKQVPCDGLVVDPEGRPIAGVEMDLWIKRTALVRDGSLERIRSVGNAEILRARSDADGRFAFRGIPSQADPFRYVINLIATHPRYEAAEYHFGRNERPRSGMNFTLRVGSKIGGTVLDHAGRPVADASVRMEPLVENGRHLATLTDVDGRFHVDNLSPGEWRVVVDPIDQAMSWTLATASREVPLDLKITVPAGGYLSGEVIGPDGKPDANSAVGWLKPLDADGRELDQPSPDRITHTLPDGSFRLGPVPEGRYKILGLISRPRSEAYDIGETGQTDLLIRHGQEDK